jgi:hypothetical protein
MKLTYEQCYAIGQANGVSSAVVESIARATSAIATEGGEAVAFYDGRSKEPCLLWAFDGYKPAPHDVVLVAAPQSQVDSGEVKPAATARRVTWKGHVHWELDRHTTDLKDGDKLYLAAPQSQGEKAVASEELRGLLVECRENLDRLTHGGIRDRITAQIDAIDAAIAGEKNART